MTYSFFIVAIGSSAGGFLRQRGGAAFPIQANVERCKGTPTGMRLYSLSHMV